MVFNLFVKYPARWGVSSLRIKFSKRSNQHKGMLVVTAGRECIASLVTRNPLISSKLILQTMKESIFVIKVSSLLLCCRETLN